MENAPKRRLSVNLSEIEYALEDSSFMVKHFLDLETGEVIPITEEISSQLEAIYEEYYIPGDEDFDLRAALEASDLSDWEKDAVLEASQVETQFGQRYIRIPEGDSHQGYRDMEDFIDTVENQRLGGRLEQAIRGKGAFRRFKDVLGDYPAERMRWFEFTNARWRERALEWLESEGIEPILEEEDKL